MILVVADTSPINYLVQIGAVHILPHFFDQVVIPQSVRDELLDPATPSGVRNWVLHLPAWAVVRAATRIEPLNLDKGETEAIALAQELHAFAVLLDDSAARQKARERGVRVTGTVGILERAAAANLIDLTIAIRELQETSYYASPALLQAALDRDAERRRKEKS